MAATQTINLRFVVNLRNDNVMLQYESSNVVKFDLLTNFFLLLIFDLKLNISNPSKPTISNFFFGPKFVSKEQKTHLVLPTIRAHETIKI